MTEVKLTWQQVVDLIRNGQRTGKTDAAIELAVEWIEKAGQEFERLMAESGESIPQDKILP